MRKVSVTVGCKGWRSGKSWRNWGNCDIFDFIYCFKMQNMFGVINGKNRIEKVFPFLEYSAKYSSKKLMTNYRQYLIIVRVSQFLQWHIITFSVSIMNKCNQSYCSATTPTGRYIKADWYKTHKNHDILAKNCIFQYCYLETKLLLVKADIRRYGKSTLNHRKHWIVASLETEPDTFCGAERIYLFLHLLNMLGFIVLLSRLVKSSKKNWH